MQALGQGDLITGLPQVFLDEFEAEIRGRVPREKIEAQLRQEKIARIMHQAGPTQIETLGQLKCSIDARLYFRMKADMGRHEGWLEDMLRDNPELCAPGYKAGRKGDLRHGVTFVNGVPSGMGPKTA